MENGQQKMIWTIGHSTRNPDEFIEMLKFYDIGLLADIRSFPGSKRYPHFNKEALEKSIPLHNIEYRHFRDLGGRRKVNPDSHNTAWKHPAFRGYADYMESDEFKEAIAGLEQVAARKRTAMMCSEAVWWRCHRSMVSDWLKASGWTVMHIMGQGKSEEHPFTAPAKIVDGELTYKLIL